MCRSKKVDGLEGGMEVLKKDLCLPYTGERFVPEMRGRVKAEHLHRYLMARQMSKGKKVVDIASGEGYGAFLLAQVAEEVRGVDASVEAVSHARKKYERENLQFTVGLCADIPIEDDWADLIVSFETIEHHVEHELMLSEFKRILRPGGTVIISSPDKLIYSDIPNYRDPYHVKELYKYQFKSLLEKFFKHNQMFGQKFFLGSFILPKFPNELDLLQADMTNKNKGEPVVLKSTYNISISSDFEIPNINPSFFELEVTEIEELDEQIKKNLQMVEELNSTAKKLNEVTKLEAEARRAKKIAFEKRNEALKEQEHLLRELEKASKEQDDAKVVEGEREESIEERKKRMALEVLLERQKIESNARISDLTRKIENRFSEIAQLTANMVKTEDESKNLKKQIEIIKKELLEKDRQLIAERIKSETLEKSKSYRYMKPFRLLAKPLKKIKKRLKQRKQIAILERSPYFDPNWYLEKYQDVKNSGMKPSKHFLIFGAQELRDPGPDFNTSYYLWNNEDVLMASFNPLIHYILHGEQEGRKISP